MLNDFPALAEEGEFARAIDGFEPREQQQAMAAAVARAIAGQYALLCEAGTGTGKTLAYLIPALQAGVRVIISTGTRNLQDQLFEKDLPMVRSALGQPVKVGVLKGRANYLCLHRLNIAEGAALDTILSKRLVSIRRWSVLTTRGDLAELTTLSDDDLVRQMVTSTADNCLGQECPEYARCHVLKARRAAMDADVVIVNHHLYFADLALREDGFGELLPDAKAIIFDEAHQLPEVATRFFGWTISATQLRELADDAERVVRSGAGDMRAAQRAAGQLREGVSVMRAALTEFGQTARGRGGIDSAHQLWDGVREQSSIGDALLKLTEALDTLSGALDVDDGGGEMSSCLRRALGLRQRVGSLRIAAEDDVVRWVEVRGRGFTWRVAPLEVAKLFGDHLRANPVAWIFTSATLAVDGSFAHFSERMGIAAQEMHVWESPFDYMQQALCYLPTNLPEPRAPDYTDRLMDVVLPLLKAGQGRAFLLFTSHRALQASARWLEGKMTYPILVQGQAPKAELVRQFVEHGNAVLLGTTSFWEGVDVRGDALGCVVIDKLPFASPDDPVLDARVRAMREAGREPFKEYQMPLAVINLKQGAGRLIRSRQDRGVLVLGDPRLVNKGYGRIFLRSLPTMPITQDADEASAFLTANPSSSANS